MAAKSESPVIIQRRTKPLTHRSGGLISCLHWQKYFYDASGNFQYRTNNTLVENSQVNSLTKSTTESNGGMFTAMETTTSIATSVTVNGSNGVIYGDDTFVVTNMPLTNSYTALALGSGLAATSAVTFNPETNSVFEYDGNGNLTHDGVRNFAYDNKNQLVQICVLSNWMSQFVYDGKMRRRKRTESTWQGGAWVVTNTVLYVYDGNLVIQERSTNSQPLVTYTRGQDPSGSGQGAGGIGGLLARTDTNGSTFYHADGNGNITVLVNASQSVVAKYLYDAFGNTISKSGLLADVNLYRFSSKELHSNSSLLYYLSRYYNPNLQRWLNRDPLRESGFEIASIASGPNAAHTLRALLGEKIDANLYQFLGNASIDEIDVFGLWPSWTWPGQRDFDENDPTAGGH